MQAYHQWLEWLEKSAWSVGIRQSLWLYPALEIVHILGIVFLVGAAFLFDLRLLGFSRNLPVIALSKHLLPWSQRGLILIVPSGVLLFLTNAQALGVDPVFWTKVGLIVVAALNVLVFHRFIYEPFKRCGAEGELPYPARLCGVVSIGVWVAVVACGRLLAY
ncbi:hypothetical protein J2Y45_003260 [Dyadobacter sp. BE34]|uniref:DUF6644 domain-containing protein n=1 Tax=Dyadobacter fermentans TaxID=94254 RepID=A0ABU1QY28_9BACT|nr:MULTISPECIES: DUF6644 family protein [Dyadobacter]MDR6806068.1 hypothetical protein [Dyadobacter fermentans]MDR7043809.1 hypothetical protein [Dyadobacter sp. BE242]MDR7198120.1 hypothetical protein [Dyadobacter sp. BE34]MDR7216083.1 hypothetical protein [Dyadobacter sp. BE31]MDR7264391.1 hypothetical protein [Dyadobacter sp. BE32]